MILVIPYKTIYTLNSTADITNRDTRNLVMDNL